MENRFGLNPAALDKINKVFAGVPEIKKVIIYGSRAKGNYRNGSDIDILIAGKRLFINNIDLLLRTLHDVGHGNNRANAKSVSSHVVSP